MNLHSRPKLESSSYDRASCKVGLVHLGYVAFHRAHQAVYIDDYMETTGDLAWGIAAVNLRAADVAAFHAASGSDDGYLLKTTSPDGEVRYRLIRPHIAFEDWSTDAAAAEALLDSEDVKAVSMTVTESGYFLKADWSLDLDAPEIKAEMQGQGATTIYGYLAAALQRRAAGINAPITVLCCDNIRSNGKILEKNFLAYLQACGMNDLADWVRANASFPCSMVDRITPRSSQVLIDEIGEAFPGRSLAPIHGENFIQWVVQNKFANTMPDLAKVGVEVVDDVDPFEEAKIRILNGGHTGLCYLGALAGYQTFDEAMRDPTLRAHFDGWETENVLPGLTLDLPFDKTAYLAEIAARFGNRAIADDLARICMDGWSKMQIFIWPTLESCLAQGISPTYGYDCIASWYVYARRVAADAMPIAYTEPHWSALEALLAPGKEAEFAACETLWSHLPKAHAEFVPGVVEAIHRMEQSWPA